MNEKPRRGRPVTKAEPDHTVLSRIPLSLWQALERYAKLHKQSISELVRDGITMRLDADPRTLYASHSTPDITAGIERRMVHRLAEQLTDLAATLAAGADTLRENLSPQSNTEYINDKSNTEYIKDESEDVEVSLPSNGFVLQVLQKMAQPMLVGEDHATDGQAGAVAPESTGTTDVPDFDHTLYQLGPLCKRGHTYGDTDQSLREIRPGRGGRGDCVECHRERARASNARRQTTSDADGGVAFHRMSTV